MDQYAARLKRRLSTELTTTSTSDQSTTTVDDLYPGEYKFLASSSSSSKHYSTHECQTSDDLVEIAHQSVQTNRLIRSDKSTYTDFIDQPLCENSTQTTRKEEQETQTTDLNYPNDSHVYLFDLKHSHTQCDDISEPCSTSSSPRASPTALVSSHHHNHHHHQWQQQQQKTGQKDHVGQDIQDRRAFNHDPPLSDVVDARRS